MFASTVICIATNDNHVLILRLIRIGFYEFSTFIISLFFRGHHHFSILRTPVFCTQAYIKHWERRGRYRPFSVMELQARGTFVRIWSVSPIQHNNACVAATLGLMLIAHSTAPPFLRLWLKSKCVFFNLEFTVFEDGDYTTGHRLAPRNWTTTAVCVGVMPVGQNENFRILAIISIYSEKCTE